MDISQHAERERDLVTYYDNEIDERSDRNLSKQRVAGRSAFIERMHREARRTVLEVGCGPSHDGQALADAGLVYMGVDLAPHCVETCRALGLDAEVASVLDLPFADASFDAGWTMSALLHIANVDLDGALAEIVRVLRPGAPLAIGTWGSPVSREGHWSGREFGPPRFVSIRSDEDLQHSLHRFGSVDLMSTWPGEKAVHYQWVVLQTLQE